MTRNEAREILMQILYEMDASKELTIENAEKLAAQRLTGNHKERGAKLLTGIINDLDNIDETINKYSTKWKTTRMPKVDLAVMRLAIGEIRYADDIPQAVSVNESINLAKKFSTENSARFIHGVLGTILKDE